jgi:hypothetical protein
LSIFNQTRQAYLCYLSKPKANRPVYRAVFNAHAKNILEMGVGDGQQALRWIEVAKIASPGEEIRYVGLDPFEGRSPADGPGLSFKDAHQLLRGQGVNVKLVPGDPAESLIRTANSLGKIDILLLPSSLDTPECSRLWFFIPRLLHENSLVFVEHLSEDGSTEFHLKPREEINSQATVSNRRAA